MPNPDKIENLGVFVRNLKHRASAERVEALDFRGRALVLRGCDQRGAEQLDAIALEHEALAEKLERAAEYFTARSEDSAQKDKSADDVTWACAIIDEAVRPPIAEADPELLRTSAQKLLEHHYLTADVRDAAIRAAVALRAMAHDVLRWRMADSHQDEEPRIYWSERARAHERGYQARRAEFLCRLTGED